MSIFYNPIADIYSHRIQLEFIRTKEAQHGELVLPEENLEVLKQLGYSDFRGLIKMRKDIKNLSEVDKILKSDLDEFKNIPDLLRLKSIDVWLYVPVDVSELYDISRIKSCTPSFGYSEWVRVRPNWFERVFSKKYAYDSSIYVSYDENFEYWSAPFTNVKVSISYTHGFDDPILYKYLRLLTETIHSVKAYDTFLKSLQQLEKPMTAEQKSDGARLAAKRITREGLHKLAKAIFRTAE